VKERKERGLPARDEKEGGQDARAPLGVSSASLEESGQDGRSPAPALFLDPYSDIDIHEHHLPHWQQGDVFYFVTYRLADALPAEKLGEWRDQKDAWMRHHPKPWDAKTEAEYHRLFSARIDDWLDAGHGSCILRQPALARIVADAFHHFDGKRYDLDSFVVMPNHVHVLFQLRAGEALGKVVHSGRVLPPRKLTTDRSAGVSPAPAESGGKNTGIA
jgi:hypothetical protein